MSALFAFRPVSKRLSNFDNSGAYTVMQTPDANYYLEKAKECREAGDKAMDLEAKTYWQQAEAVWLELASIAKAEELNDKLRWARS
jgi:hypothetical protein